MFFFSKKARRRSRLHMYIVLYFPTLLVLAIMGWAYYTYIIDYCFHILANSVTRWTYLIVFHIIYVLFLWAYLRILFSKTPHVPMEFHVTEDEYETIKLADSLQAKEDILEDICKRKNLVILTRDSSKSIRFCYKCKLIKPDRAHHCSICQTCILKMDHHCPWVGSCISFVNYKFFMLFLFYGSLVCVFVAATTLGFFLSVLNTTYRTYAQIHVIIGFLMSVTVGVMLISFFLYHTALTLKNQTTLEAFRKPTFKESNESLTFDMGKSSNFAEIFGKTCWKWFLPLDTSLGNGINFPIMFVL